jgi:TP901 family phage tail tape measure protein
MAQAFNLTAQLQLQAPNTQQVAQQIQNDLGSININVGIQQNAQALSGINRQLEKTNKAAGSASKSMNFLNKGLAEAARRFSVITVATGSFIALARGIRNSVGAAVEFERELVKISQVTGTSVGSLDSLQKRVTGLSTQLGVANATLLQTARVLTQAGLSARKTSQALEVLANTTLAPSFDNIIDTTEGAIAILNQFGRQAAKTGSDIRFLEESLDAINQVSKNFAVESADLISAVRRTGGVFQAAGGNLKELVALFTSVRQTTRESAETIATGFRTIFTRLQRKDTIEALKELGIVLTDVQGKFVGPLKAIEALSTGLAGLDPKDVRFNEIVEQLGGFRQIGKVIPLLKQYAVTQNALAVANSSSGSTAKDAQTAQQSLAQQFAKTREQFDALIRKFSGSDTFQGLAKTILKLANSFLKFAESLENVLPLLTSIAAIKIGQNLAPGVASLIGGRRKNAGGRILGFNSGGMVPGNGNRDTVPAMLTPGEFVIRKGSVQNLGAENLARMNEGRARYNKGTTGTGAKKSDAKKGAIVKAGGGAQASHIGPAIELSDAELKKFFSDYGGLTGRGNAKFKRSFAQNVAGISTTKIVDGKEVNKSAAELYGAEYKAALEKTISNSASLNQARRSIGLKAQNPTLLNWPSTFNQALRVTDPNLVAKDDLIAATSREKNLVKIGGRAASAKFSDNVPVRSALVSAIKKTPTKKKNERDGRATFDVDSELDGLKGVLISAIEAQDEQVAGQLLRDVDFIFKGGKAITSKGKARTSQERFQKKNFTQKALGGLIQKFAAGGIVEQGAAGAAILDPIGTSSSTVKVSNEDVKKSFGEFSKLPRGKDPVSQFYKPKSFAISKSGLNQQTSDKFKNILEDGLVTGINDSAAALSRDLGTPSATIAKGETGNFVRSINTSVFGRLYETVIESISNSGKFSGSDPNRPFDAEGGLPSGLKDNFSGLPAKFIDLKSSEEAAGEKNLKGKVVQQIKRELIQDGILSADYPGKAQADKKRSDQEVKTQRERDKKAAKSQGFDATVGRRRGFNKGGGISGKDTVPALLTPGEFVFSKEASQSIGYGNLSKMNTQGVKGYNKGGVVGFKKYANGTGPTGVPSGGGGGIASLDLSGIQAAIATLEATANDYSQSLSSNSAALDRAKAANEDTASLVAEKAQSEATLAAVYNKLGELYDSEEFAKLEIAEAKLTETTKKQDKQVEELIKAEEAAELAARKGAERQPKKERVGPSGPQAKGDSVSISKGANESLKAIASSGVKLAGVQQLYLKTLQTGVGKNAALNATSDAVAKVLEENKTSVQESIQANQFD